MINTPELNANSTLREENRSDNQDLGSLAESCQRNIF